MDCDTTHDADDLVTEEMVAMAVGLLFGGPRRAEDYQAIGAILRAVAPMIAARALERHYDDLAADSRARLERAAAIRARGETP
jgi:hypothetical protein